MNSEGSPVGGGQRGAGRISRRDNDFALGVLLSETPECFARLIERVEPVDDGHDLAVLEELFHVHQILSARLRQQEDDPPFPILEINGPRNTDCNSAVPEPPAIR